MSSPNNHLAISLPTNSARFNNSVKDAHEEEVDRAVNVHSLNSEFVCFQTKSGLVFFHFVEEQFPQAKGVQMIISIKLAAEPKRTRNFEVFLARDEETGRLSGWLLLPLGEIDSVSYNTCFLTEKRVSRSPSLISEAKEGSA